MIEEHEDDFLVKVRAQVMTRDESTEGWLPLAGGGLANVSIRKRARLPPNVGGHEYIMYGQRISDQTIILSCAINRDLQYNKVMPTFHHWRAGKQRNGLTFQTAADARAFDKGVVRAYDELIAGMNVTNNSQWSQIQKYNHLAGEDDVFMTLDLPIEPTESRSSSEANGSQKSGDRHKNIHIISSDSKSQVPTSGSSPIVPQKTNLSTKISTTTTTVQQHQKLQLHQKQLQQQQQQQQQQQHQQQSRLQQQQSSQVPPGENYSYVQLTASHEYNHQVADEPTTDSLAQTDRRDSTNSIQKPSALEVTSQTLKEIHMRNRLRCRYCQEVYTEALNKRGACEFAPDCFKNGLEQMTGMKCARCMLYHCMSDSEGETPQHPCECVFESGCTKRWIGLAFLSIIVPCLWCYPPFRMCHWIGVSCGICGGKHQPHMNT